MSGCGQVPREAACIVVAWRGAQAGDWGPGVCLEWGSPVGLTCRAAGLGDGAQGVAPLSWEPHIRVCGCRWCEAHTHWEGGGT